MLLGVVESDWLGSQVGVFSTEKPFIEELGKMGAVIEEDPVASNAFVNTTYIANIPYFSVVFTKKDYGTILHESSHLVDVIFEHKGIEPCTEVRAYFHTWLFREICTIPKKKGSQYEL